MTESEPSAPPPERATEPLVDQVIRAHNEIVRLCTTRDGWRMSVPANPMRDSDLILSDALTALDSAFAAAIERAERAEAEVAALRSEVGHWVTVASTWKGRAERWKKQRDQARAQLAKVREWASTAASIDAGERGDYTATVHGERNYTNALATREHGETLLAILDPVSATEDEAPADPCRGGCGPGYRYGDDGCRHTPPASPAAVEPERVEPTIHDEGCTDPEREDASTCAERDRCTPANCRCPYPAVPTRADGAGAP